MSYNPTIGRWISEDPIGFQAADPNLFRYVVNSPTNYMDPSGLEKYKYLPKPRDLTDAEVINLSKVFPYFNSMCVQVVGEADNTYNCIAHAFGLKEGRIDRSNPPLGSKIEPPGDWMTGDYINDVAKFYGYKKSLSTKPERDKIKVIVYGREYIRRGKPAEYTILHAAVESGDGSYYSKNGDLELINHPSLTILDGGKDQKGLYGKILYAYEKPKPGANGHLR